MLLAGRGISKAALTCVTAALALVAATGAANPAAAAGSGGAGHYADFDFSTGQVTDSAAGFPAAHIATDSTNPSSPSGTSAFLNASTPFGQAFGSSQGDPYALLRLASGRRPSTTTVSFDTAPDAGSWGFALGDVDAENVRVAAYDASGGELPVSDLGFEDTFNYCDGSPLPGTCHGSRQTDRPRWDPATGTLKGNVADTDGASGWFQPGTRISKLVLTATLNAGIPAFQLWIAAHDQAEPTPPPAHHHHHHHPQPEPASQQVEPGIVPIDTAPGEPSTQVICPSADCTFDLVEDPHHGTVTFDAADGSVTYSPAGGFSGTDRFIVKAVEPGRKAVFYRFEVVVGLAETGVYHLPELGAVGGGMLVFGGVLRAGVRGRRRPAR